MLQEPRQALRALGENLDPLTDAGECQAVCGVRTVLDCSLIAGITNKLAELDGRLEQLEFDADRVIGAESIAEHQVNPESAFQEHFVVNASG